MLYSHALQNKVQLVQLCQQALKLTLIVTLDYGYMYNHTSLSIGVVRGSLTVTLPVLASIVNCVVGVMLNVKAPPSGSLANAVIT